MATTEPHQAIEAVFRIERARLVAGLAGMVRDVGRAEELAQDALVAALDGLAAERGAAQSRRLADGGGQAAGDRRLSAARGCGRESTPRSAASSRRRMPRRRRAVEAALDDAVGDELLGLIFVACHPVLAPEARAALTLRLIGGLTTDEIARAFLAREPTIAQRIVRAKKALRAAGGRLRGAAGAGARRRGSARCSRWSI